jgi:uncharacterized protein YjeT (DUF2065 family)
MVSVVPGKILRMSGVEVMSFGLVVSLLLCGELLRL